MVTITPKGGQLVVSAGRDDIDRIIAGLEAGLDITAATYNAAATDDVAAATVAAKATVSAARTAKLARRAARAAKAKASN
jgi:hypothetical protein